MVALLVLVQAVKVRILVGQPSPYFGRGIFKLSPSVIGNIFGFDPEDSRFDSWEDNISTGSV